MDRIEVYRDADGELRWRFVRHGNNKIMTTGAEGYMNPKAVEQALCQVFGAIAVARGAHDHLSALILGGRRDLIVNWDATP